MGQFEHTPGACSDCPHPQHTVPPEMDDVAPPQGVHVVVPVLGATAPGAHSPHEDVPAWAANVPLGHPAQDPDPTPVMVEFVPAGQPVGVHPEASVPPAVAKYFPGALSHGLVLHPAGSVPPSVSKYSPAWPFVHADVGHASALAWPSEKYLPTSFFVQSEYWHPVADSPPDPVKYLPWMRVHPAVPQSLELVPAEV